MIDNKKGAAAHAGEGVKRQSTTYIRYGMAYDAMTRRLTYAAFSRFVPSGASDTILVDRPAPEGRN